VPNIDKHYPESRFGGFSDIDGTVTFYSRVNALLVSVIKTTKQTKALRYCGSHAHHGVKVI